MLKFIITKDKQGLVWVSQDQNYWVGFQRPGLHVDYVYMYCISVQKKEGDIWILRKYKCMYVPVFSEQR